MILPTETERLFREVPGSLIARSILLRRPRGVKRTRRRTGCASPTVGGAFFSKVWRDFAIESLSSSCGDLPQIRKNEENAVRRNSTVVFAHGYVCDLRRLGHPIHAGIPGPEGGICFVNLLHWSVWSLPLCFGLSRAVSSV